MRLITSRRNDAVSRFRDLAGDRRSTSAHVLLDGTHLIGEARAAGIRFEMVAVSASRLHRGGEEAQLAAALDADGVDVLAAPDAVFRAMSPVRTPSGLVAIVHHEPAPAADICARDAAFVVTAVDVQDPGNIGGLLRVAEAGGATGALVCTTRGGAAADPFSWKALRGSMGSALRLPVADGLTADGALDCLAAAGARTVAAVARGGHEPDAVDWSGRIGLVLGGEGPGLPDELAARCEERVTIPMTPGVESLNVAVAGGILIYAARRQRS